ncbi:MAG TPA: TetR/AcrR family transcriptional regulator [Rhodocyclaceae bacterium]|nr:TetR/AcrR family transcriptional regulator [Rhodocyclaceae bacterium]
MPAESLGQDYILEQALPLFAAQGYGAVTMRMIARAAGLTIGTLYHYFPSKRALYMAVLDRAYGRAAQHWAQEVLYGSDDPNARLATYVREYCAFVASHHDFVRLMKREQLEGDAEQMELQARSLFASQYQATVDLFAELAPQRDPTLLAHSLLALVLHHYEVRALRPLFPGYKPEHDDPAHVAEHVLAVLLHGIEPTA